MNLFISDALAETTAKAEIATPAAPVPEDLSASKMMTDNLLMLALLFGIFYFILIRPQQKRIKDHRTMLSTLAKGNRVITSGGLIGTIAKLEGDDIVVIEIAQGVRVRIAKSAITEITAAPAGNESANDN